MCRCSHSHHFGSSEAQQWFNSVGQAHACFSTPWLLTMMSMIQLRRTKRFGSEVFSFSLEEHFGAQSSSREIHKCCCLYEPYLTTKLIFRGNHGLFMVLRAILTLAIFLGMLIFAIFCLIIWPVSETGMVPVKTLISTSIRWDFQSLSPAWR